jgi:pimeloyl-ACP methyl ester carboxylesterase
MSGDALFDPVAEAERIAFDRAGAGERVLLISGFPQTRLSWNRLVPRLAARFETIAADLPGFGESGFLTVPATTKNVARIFHAFALRIGTPLHVVATTSEPGSRSVGPCCFRMNSGPSR